MQTADEADELQLNPPVPVEMLVIGADHPEAFLLYCTPFIGQCCEQYLPVQQPSMA